MILSQMNRWVMLGVFASGISLGAFAEDSAPTKAAKTEIKSGKMVHMAKMSEMTPETRKKMAEMHQMMADCLKSDKKISECHEMMMKDCPMKKESGSCPMMDEMHMMGGHDHGKMMNKKSSDKKDTTQNESEEKHEDHH